MTIKVKGAATALALILVTCAAGNAVAAPAAASAPAVEPSPWTAQIEAGTDYRGDFTAEDRTMVGVRQVAAKCAMLPSNQGDGFDVSLRQTSDNKISNLINLSLILEVGVGSCSDFKLIRASAYDPSAPLALGDNGRVRFYSGGGDYAVRVMTLAREPEKDPFLLRVRKLDPSVRARTFQPGGVGVAAASALSRTAAANGVEEARTAYLQMCGKGQERLSAATCEGMRRDLETAAAAQAAAAREAEVMGVYRQICGSPDRKLSEETCAAMLAEAKRTLATPAAGAAPAAAADAPAPGRADAELKSAYEELCASGPPQVSAETCAALKADAASRRPRGSR